MNTVSMKTLLAVALSAALAGCSLIPKYDRPAAPVDAAYPVGPAYDADAQAKARPDNLATADIGWREFFTDPLLQTLIEQSLANNRDLRVAALNVQAAQAQYRISRSDLFPTVGVGANGSVQRTPADLSPSGEAGISRQYQVGASLASWELDLFGRIRSLNQQALEEYLSLDETRVATQLSLISEMANAYLTMRADQELLGLTEETLASQHKSYDLTKLSYDGGVGTELDLSQAEVSVRTAERNYSLYVRQVAQDRNALVLLLGQPLSPELDTRLTQASHLDDNSMPTNLPPGLPSELLARRPDIRAAEHALLGANANIGAARAAFFPSIGLTASAGTASSSLGGLFKGGSGAWSFAPTLSVPIFTSGQLTASLDLAKVQKNIQVAQYEKSIQTSFREVADALAGRGTLDHQIASQQALVAANDRAYKVSDQLFRQGISNYLSVLDSQRSLYQSQQDLVATRLQRVENLVALYRVLGGGWTEHSVTPQAENKASLTP
jgi:multidrug efflux system outer membrane protein